MKEGRGKVSLTAILVVALVEFSASFYYYPKWENQGTEAVISWDASGYYMYLPALFIYHDIKKCGFQDYVLEKYQPTPDFQQAFLHHSGNYVMKYSCGQAIMLSPAFFVAHIYATVSHKYPADGFSLPYQITVAVWCLLLSLAGLFVLRKVLLFYFDDKTAALTIIAIALCTNYFDYAVFGGAMTHNTLFTLYAVLLLVTAKFYEQPKLYLAVLIGGLCGLATITRPTEIISILIPVCWGITNLVSVRERILFLSKNRIQLLLAVCAFAGMVFIQLFYWKTVSGEWLVYSYQNQTFDWFHPHIYNCLFSTKAGWLLYSPIMFLSLTGFYFMYREKQTLLVVCLIFILPFMYLCFAWSEWWYGWSLGQRAMIQAYPVLAFPLAMSLKRIRGMAFGKIVVFTMLFLSFIYNVWLVHQSHRGGLLKGAEMNRAYYLAILGKMKVSEQTFTLLDNADYVEAPSSGIELIYKNDFSSDTSQNTFFTDSIGLDKKIRLNQELQRSQEYFLSGQFRKGKYYKVSADFSAKNKEWNNWKMCQFIVRFYKQGREVKSNMIRVFRLLNDYETKNIHFYAKSPDTDFDDISVSFWNADSDKEMVIDNVKVEVGDYLKVKKITQNINLYNGE